MSYAVIYCDDSDPTCEWWEYRTLTQARRQAKALQRKGLRALLLERQGEVFSVLSVYVAPRSEPAPIAPIPTGSTVTLQIPAGMKLTHLRPVLRAA